jgi:hypothetical protein
MSTDGNPYQSPDLPSLSGSPANPKPDLGSLAQSARTDQLKSARGIFIFIGILTIIANIFFWTQLRKEVRKELNAEVARERAAAKAEGMELDEAVVAKYLRDTEEEVMKYGNYITIGTIVLGVVFIVFGIFVTAAPVPITIAGLVLYLLAAVGFAILDPESILKGAIIKVFVVFGMVKAIRSALAYEREKRMTEREQFTY